MPPSSLCLPFPSLSAIWVPDGFQLFWEGWKDFARPPKYTVRRRTSLEEEEEGIIYRRLSSLPLIPHSPGIPPPLMPSSSSSSSLPPTECPPRHPHVSQTQAPRAERRRVTERGREGRGAGGRALHHALMRGAEATGRARPLNPPLPFPLSFKPLVDPQLHRQ